MELPIIQPGGSIRDEDSIQACNKLGISMVLPGFAISGINIPEVSFTGRIYGRIL